MTWIHTLYDWVLNSAMSVWALVVAYTFSMIDGFFPPIPSESIITGLAAIYVKSDPLRLVPLTLCGAAGAWCGDNIAFLIGRRLHPVLGRHRPEFAAKVMAASERVRHRGAALIITARFIPVGRVVVNMGAGFAEFPHRRFMGIAAVSGVIWSLYAVLIGIAAGNLVHDNPLLGAVIGIVLGVVIGVVVDRILDARERRAAAAAGTDA